VSCAIKSGDVPEVDVIDNEIVVTEAGEGGALHTHAPAGRRHPEQLALVRAGGHPAVGVVVAVDDQLEALEAEVREGGEDRGRLVADRGPARRSSGLPASR
jgi:hypothetical protein